MNREIIFNSSSRLFKLSSLVLLSLLLSINSPNFAADSPKSSKVKKSEKSAEKSTSDKSAADKSDSDKDKKDDKSVDKADKKDAEKGKEKEQAKAPEKPIENVVNVNADDLVDKPHEYMGKNVKFTAPFFAFSTLALDYKPAYRSSKTHISLLVARPKKKTPLSELKLAMMTPKEKDPETQLLATLKEGDTLEIIGNVFSTALDDPWVEILKVKKIGGSTDDKKADASSKAKINDTKSNDSKTDKTNGGKSDGDAKTPNKN